MQRKPMWDVTAIVFYSETLLAFQHLHQTTPSYMRHDISFSFKLSILLPKKASTRQLTPLMALKKIWGSCFKHGCSTTSWGIPLELRNCSWNFGVVLTIAGLLRSTGLLETNRERRKFMLADATRAYLDLSDIWLCRGLAKHGISSLTFNIVSTDGDDDGAILTFWTHLELTTKKHDWERQTCFQACGCSATRNEYRKEEMMNSYKKSHQMSLDFL